MSENQLDNQTTGYIKGELLFTIFENEQEHFSIAKIKVVDTNESYDEKEIVVKGYFSSLQQGVTYQFFGQLVIHQTFGEQYDVSSYQTYVPDTEDGLIQFLSSDLFPGIGKKTAETIVDHLGNNAINKILENNDVLLEIPRMNKKAMRKLVKTLKEYHGFEQVAVQLTKYGVSLKVAQLLYKTYKEETLQYVLENPFQFVFDIEGFGFPTADKIAHLNGLDKTDDNRIAASCIHALQLATLDGHVYLPMEQCIEKMQQILRVNTLTNDDLNEKLTTYEAERKIIVQEEKVYLPPLYFAEEGFAVHLQRIMEDDVETETTDAELMKMIGEIEEADAINYGVEQFTAINQALHSKIMILTGGPGTGKTTVIKAIIKAYADIHHVSTDISDYSNDDDFPFILTAPTGRAAKRLQESTNMKATTIHRLLGWDGNKTFEKNEHEKLSGKYLIVDEFSMVDTWLANHLFKAIPSDMQVLLVGDEDQLPSVGPGQVLSDLLSSSRIKKVQLNEVYRQKQGSKIIQLAHQIKRDECTLKDIEKDADFSFIECNEHQVTDVIINIVQKADERGIDLSDIQILAPMYRSIAGINEINKQVQQLVNPKSKSKRERRVNDVVYRIGDRVIQLINQPEDGVYNGDIGEIVAIFKASENEEKEEQIIISFDDNDVVYTRSDYLNFMHAFCISIHKSQGSEFPIVILPVLHVYRRMLRKNLLYTAITRSQQSLILCGQKDAFIDGIHTKDTNVRYTTLKEHLTAQVVTDESDEAMPEKTLHEDDYDISPFDFM